MKRLFWCWNVERIMGAHERSSPMTNAALRDSLGLEAEVFQWLALIEMLQLQQFRFQA
jgi:hypothetical protein